jgi:1-phosphatidylinositol-3-phosphate 5-kinase
MKAIEADSQFLSSKFVMDYSLLCGFDQVNDELIVGIIGKKYFIILTLCINRLNKFIHKKDYLRVFTWDKKVETYIKTISGQGKMPTIVSPEVYRKRFINAIDRYFLSVPDQWYSGNSEVL